MPLLTSPYAPEPNSPPDAQGRVGVLLVNLGSPEAPTPAAVRRYLAQFLSDPRVVELPKALWAIVLHGIILRVRPRRSAAKYARIWQADGSPLRQITEAQTTLLRDELAARGHVLELAFAMRYGSPAIPAQLDSLKKAGCDRILILPLYPQYAASTTATVVDEVARWLLKTRRQPAIRTVGDFHDDAAYIDSLAESLRAHWHTHGPLGPEDRLLISFHGLPAQSEALGDPYAQQCRSTAAQLAAALELPPEQVLQTFQSRFGPSTWLQPYTDETVKALAQQGVRRVDVVCPGFVADCLETLEEISMEVREVFLLNGGTHFHYIPCLNTRPDWIQALAGLTETHLAGWCQSVRPELVEGEQPLD